MNKSLGPRLGKWGVTLRSPLEELAAALRSRLGELVATLRPGEWTPTKLARVGIDHYLPKNTLHDVRYALAGTSTESLLQSNLGRDYKYLSAAAFKELLVALERVIRRLDSFLEDYPVDRLRDLDNQRVQLDASFCEAMLKDPEDDWKKRACVQAFEQLHEAQTEASKSKLSPRPELIAAAVQRTLREVLKNHASMDVRRPQAMLAAQVILYLLSQYVLDLHEQHKDCTYSLEQLLRTILPIIEDQIHWTTGGISQFLKGASGTLRAILEKRYNRASLFFWNQGLKDLPVAIALLTIMDPLKSVLYATIKDPHENKPARGLIRALMPYYDSALTALRARVNDEACYTKESQISKYFARLVRDLFEQFSTQPVAKHDSWMRLRPDEGTIWSKVRPQIQHALQDVHVSALQIVRAEVNCVDKLRKKHGECEGLDTIENQRLPSTSYANEHSEVKQKLQDAINKLQEELDKCAKYTNDEFIKNNCAQTQKQFSYYVFLRKEIYVFEAILGIYEALEAICQDKSKSCDTPHVEAMGLSRRKNYAIWMSLMEKVPVHSAVQPPVTSTVKSPVTSAVKSPVTSAVKSPVTSAVKSPVTSAVEPPEFYSAVEQSPAPHLPTSPSKDLPAKKFNSVSEPSTPASRSSPATVEWGSVHSPSSDSVRIA